MPVTSKDVDRILSDLQAVCRKHNARIYARKDSKGEYFSAEVGPAATCVWVDLKSISPEQIERAEE